jgi:hypothetical protein
MTISGEERQVGPGDLITIPPDAVHSIRPLWGMCQFAPLRLESDSRIDVSLVMPSRTPWRWRVASPSRLATGNEK